MASLHLPCAASLSPTCCVSGGTASSRPRRSRHQSVNRLTTSSVAENTLGDASVGDCVARAVERIAFPQPEGGGVVIVPLMTLIFGVDMRYAIGASLVSVIATSMTTSVFNRPETMRKALPYS